MNKVDKLNRIRAMAGLPPVSKKEKERLEEKAKQELLIEAANHRAPSTVLADIAKQHCHVRSLSKTGDDEKDYHDIPCWALESALKAAFKAGYESKKSQSAVKESADAESSKESKEGGSNPAYKASGGEPVYKTGKDAEEKESNTGNRQPKGKSSEGYSTPKNKKAKDVVKEGGEYEEEYKSNFKKGQVVTCKGKQMIVQVADGPGTKVGLVPYDMINASDNEKNRNVKHYDHKDIVPSSEEEQEDAEAMRLGGMGDDMESELEMSSDGEDNEYEDEMDGKCPCPSRDDDESDYDEFPMEGSSEGYNNPKGTDLKADASSGAKAKKGNAYKDVPHKDNSEGAKSEDKGKAGLKKIKEAEEVTVWGKDYNYDGRVDKNESPDQFKANDPNEEAKINVPSQYKSALRTEINRLRQEAERVAIRDPLGAEFYANTAIVFEGLLEQLEQGTRRSLMLAQIDMNRVMSPMVQRIPNEVYMFIVRGGKPAALNELFKEVKVKREKGADLSKEDYTK